jgi:hypothetical protein
MKPTKDTALDAMKRAAKAVLKEELKELRRKAKDSAKVRKEASEAAWKAACRERELRDRLDALRLQVADFESRAQKVLDWAIANRSGDYGIRACAEYMQQGSTGNPTAARAGIRVNPFDRWQVTPAIR